MGKNKNHLVVWLLDVMCKKASETQEKDDPNASKENQWCNTEERIPFFGKTPTIFPLQNCVDGV